MSDPQPSSVPTTSASMPHVRLHTEAGSAMVFHHGAHLTEWTPRDTAPVLWVSAHSAWDPAKPIRGGVPICFPWFGPNPADATAPMHGWARLSEWTLAEQSADTVAFVLEQDDWALRYTVRLAQELHMELLITNLSPAERSCSHALHTYFAVGDIRRCVVHGLEEATYSDKLRDGQNFVQSGPIRFEGETDRLYYSTADVEIVDEALGRRISIAKQGSGGTVVWNPWIGKASAMPDFGDDEWPSMLCVETANALDCAITVAPGASHLVSTRISVKEL